MAIRHAFDTVRSLRRLPALRATAIGVSLLCAGTSSLQNAVANGDTRTLVLHHTHSDEDGSFTFKKNGRYDPAVLAQLNHFLRDWRNQKSTEMDPQLFDIVWEVYRETDAKAPVQIVSSYRSPETNSMLRSRSRGVAKFSQHMLGKAMDFYIPGVNLTDLRVAGLRLQRGGVGFYPTSGSPFVHMDTGSVRHWPRMNHDQLARVFPDGKTVHVPSDGRPLSNYNAALAELQARGAKPGVAVASAGGSGGNFLAKLFGRKDADDEEGAETAVAAAPREAPASAPAREAPKPQLAALAPLPPARPAELAAGALVASQAAAGQPLPFPLRRPADAADDARLAAATPLPPVITRGTQDPRASDPRALAFAAANAAEALEPRTLDARAMDRAASRAPARGGEATGDSRFLVGGLMAQTANEAPAGRARARAEAPAGGEAAAGRMVLAASLSQQSYLRIPEVRSLTELMDPPHDVTPTVYAMTFSVTPRRGDVWPELRRGQGGRMMARSM